MGNGELYRLPEVPLDQIEEAEIELIRTALHNECTPYRTISGIEAETGLQPSHIASVLINSGEARQTIWRRNGERVFAASDFKMTGREKVAHWISVILGDAR